jgi:hypothetical protein
MWNTTSHQEFTQIEQTHCCLFIHYSPMAGESNHHTHIVLFLFIIAYYCGSPFAAAEDAAKPYLEALDGPFGDAVAVSLE